MTNAEIIEAFRAQDKWLKFCDFLEHSGILIEDEEEEDEG